MKEKEIENLLLDYLKSKKIFCWKNQSVGIFDPKKRIYRKPKGKHHLNGTSDILGVLPDGRILAIEVKTPKTKANVSDFQKAFIDQIRANNGVTGVAWDINSLDAILNPLNHD